MGSADMAVSIMMTRLSFAFAAGTRKKDLINEFVFPFAEDRAAKHIGCWAVSEALHGSDQFLLGTKASDDLYFAGQLHARLDGEHYVIDGAKSAWVANAAIATHMVAWLTLALPTRGARTERWPLSRLIYPASLASRPWTCSASAPSAKTAVRFSEVRVPQGYLVVKIHPYQEELAKTLVFVHAAMGAIFTGVAQAAFDTAKVHAHGRRQGGKALVQHQLCRTAVRGCTLRVEAARALSRAAMLYDDATGPMLERAIAAKTFCTQAAFEVADSTVTLYGAQGLAREHLAARLFCDARAALPMRSERRSGAHRGEPVSGDGLIADGIDLGQFAARGERHYGDTSASSNRVMEYANVQARTHSNRWVRAIGKGCDTWHRFRQGDRCAGHWNHGVATVRVMERESMLDALTSVDPESEAKARRMSRRASDLR